MKLKNIVSTATTIVLLFSLAFPGFAEPAKPENKKIEGDYVISSEAISFLKSHNVDLTPFKKSNITNDKIASTENPAVSISKSALYDGSILSLQKQTAAYSFSDDQIQKYVKGMLETSPTVINGPDTQSTQRTLSTPYSSRVDPGGIGYEVVSTSGYYMSTAFATIPNASIGSATSGYMFWTVSSPISLSNNWGIDVGLWYGRGGDTGNIVGWRGVYNRPGGQEAVPADGSTISALTPGKQIYMVAQIRSDGYLETKVLDASDFSTVYLNFIYYVGSEGIYTSNGIFARQITLCHDNQVFTNGSYMQNAEFNLAYLYSNTGYAPVSASNTVSGQTGAFGAGGTTVNKVQVNSYTQWDSEDITITFTNP